jgi:dipeptidyl aminopeptidase/acylaminoacyl peptidase
MRSSLLILACTVILAAGASSASAGTFLFTSNHCGFEPGCPGGYEIYTAPDGGGAATRITSNDCGDGGAAWSPDGRTIAVSRRLRSAPTPGAPCNIANIWLMNADGSGARALTTGDFDEDFPDFSPNGRRVVFDSSNGSPLREHHEIWVVNADGSGLSRLTSTGADEETPHFSPDGRTIIYTRSPGGATARFTGSPVDVWAMNADGSGERPLTVGGGFLSGVQYSPDGCNVVFSNNGRIFTMTVDGLRFRRRTDRPGGVYDVEPNWSPDGREIVFGRTRLDSSGDELGTDLARLDTSDDSVTLSTPLAPVPPTSSYQIRWIDWFAPGPPSRTCGSADRVAPVTLLSGTSDASRAVSLAGTGSGATAARVKRRVVRARKDKITFTTIDRSGVKSVAVSISGGRYRHLSDFRSLRRLVTGLRTGRYVFRFKAVDRKGNRTHRPQPVTVLLR